MTAREPTAAELAALALGPYLEGMSRAEVDDLLGDLKSITVAYVAAEPMLSKACELGLADFCGLCRDASCTCSCHRRKP